jgi:hypothetical protein
MNALPFTLKTFQNAKNLQSKSNIPNQIPNIGAESTQFCYNGGPCIGH